MERVLVYDGGERTVVCDISTQPLRELGYLKVFGLYVKDFSVDTLSNVSVDSQLCHQALNGNGRAAMAFMIIQPIEKILREVDVEDIPDVRTSTIHVSCPEAVSDANLPPT